MQRQIPVLRRLLLCCGVVLLGAGCAGRSGSGSSRPLPAPFADLAAREIMSGPFVTAYDAVYGLRHEFLTMDDHHSRGAPVPDPARPTASEPSAPAYLEFHNETEDAVRVFVYAGRESWFVGGVQPFRRARLVLPTSLTMRHGQVISVGAVPIGGRGRDGTAASGALVRSDTEIIDDVADFRWTLIGHTLSPAQLPRRSRDDRLLIETR